MVGRVIFAVVAGYVTNAVLIAGTEKMLSRLVTPASYFGADVVTQCIIQLASGYLCSRIANASMRPAFGPDTAWTGVNLKIEMSNKGGLDSG